MDLQTAAPTRSLPGVVDGEFDTVDLASHVGEDVVLLVFYPSNSGPNFRHSAAVLRACATAVEQSDVAVVPFGVATESVFSHRRFAREAEVPVGLLSDAGGELSRAYDVATTHPTGQTVARLAVFVIGYQKLPIYEWRAADPGEDPPIADIRSTIENTSRGQSARGTYRLGYTLYQEGRRLLSSGFEQCEQADWALARTDFDDAGGKFAAATDKFIETQGLAEGALRERAELARARATHLWEATEWLAGYATAVNKGRSEEKREYRQEAEDRLREAREYSTLPKPGSAGAQRVE